MCLVIVRLSDNACSLCTIDALTPVLDTVGVFSTFRINGRFSFEFLILSFHFVLNLKYHQNGQWIRCLWMRFKFEPKWYKIFKEDLWMTGHHGGDELKRSHCSGIIAGLFSVIRGNKGSLFTVSSHHWPFAGDETYVPTRGSPGALKLPHPHSFGNRTRLNISYDLPLVVLFKWLALMADCRITKPCRVNLGWTRTYYIIHKHNCNHWLLQLVNETNTR